MSGFRRSKNLVDSVLGDGAASYVCVRPQVWAHHTEFAVGLDFSTLAEGVMASVGWDEMAFVWHQNGDPRSPTL